MTAPAPTAAKPQPELPRRRAVPKHPGIYYRPRRDGKIAAPYEVPYMDSDGKRRWEIIHGTLTEAEARRAELRLRRRRGEQIRPCRQTFADYARDWLDRQAVKPRTHEGYQWAINTHLIPSFGRRRIDQITVDDIAAFTTEMKKKGLKGWTITSALRPLSIMLAQAARKGQIPVNPFTQLERGERPRHDDQREKRILTLNEMQALLAATQNNHHRLLFELLLSTGMRIGEALGLTVGDLNAKDNVLRVEFQLSRDGTRTPLKTAESRRAVDISDELMTRLLAHAEELGSLFTPTAFVFQSRTGCGIERKVCREALRRAATATNLPQPLPTLHDLRHSHASMLIHLGHSIADVQHRLGHRKPDTTLRIYTHQWNYRAAQQSTIGQQLGELITPNTDQTTAAQLRELGS